MIRFDVVAHAAPEKSREQLLLMLRTLLDERFKLAVHREQKQALAPAQANAPLSNNQFRPGRIVSKGVYMPMLVNVLSRFRREPVIDFTGLKSPLCHRSDLDSGSRRQHCCRLRNRFRPVHLHRAATAVGPQTGIAQGANRRPGARLRRESAGRKLKEQLTAAAASRPIMMTIARLVVTAILSVLTLSAQAQQTLEFEVASIKPNLASGKRSGVHDDKGLWRATNVTAKFLVQMAYDVLPDQLGGLPSWADSERLDIEAKVEDDPSLAPSEASRRNRLRLQSLLQNRFQFAMHRETKDWQAYVLVLGKKGPKLKPATGKGSSMFSNNGHFEASGIGMEDFARNLAGRLGRPVVNETGLEGRFDFTLESEASASASAQGSVDDNGKPSPFTALQEQLGLKLETRKVPVEMLVVDRIEKPTGN